MSRNLAVLALFSVVGLTACNADNTEKQTNLCDFSQGSCQQKIMGESVSLSLFPKNAPAETPLNLSLAFPDDWTLNSAQVSGRDMFMGIIPVEFSTDGRAELIYGSCASDYMVWRLDLRFEDASGKMHIVDFDWLADH